MQWRKRTTLNRIVAFCCLAWLLPGVSQALTRDPMLVLLTQNADVNLPKTRTGATYTLTPTPTNPDDRTDTELMDEHQVPRLQDAGRPSHNTNSAIGWNVSAASSATVEFDLKRVHEVKVVELLLQYNFVPGTISVQCNPLSTGGTWSSAVTVTPPAGSSTNPYFWQQITVPTQNAWRVRITVTARGGFTSYRLREARVWGDLTDEAAPAARSGTVSSSGAMTFIGAGSTNNQKAQSFIVVSNTPSQKTMAAARLLQEMLYRMTSVRLPVVKVNDVSSRNDVSKFLVGQGAASSVGVTVPVTYPDNEMFVVRRVGGHLVLAGNDASPDTVNGDPDAMTAASSTNPINWTQPGNASDPVGFRGSMMAVCAFLETQGARFYRWDTRDSTKLPINRYDKYNPYFIVPTQATIGLADGEFEGTLGATQTPGFKRRSLSAFVGTYTPDRELWRVWNRVGGLLMHYTHNDILEDPEAAYAADPTWFCQIPFNSNTTANRWNPATQSGWQLCTSNPDVINYAAQAAHAAFEESPSLMSYGLTARDNNNFCQCSVCRADPNWNRADRWVRFANAVRARMSVLYGSGYLGDRKLLFYSYDQLSSPPLYTNVASGVQAMYITDGCQSHIHNTTITSCPNYTEVRGELDDWQARSPSEPVHIYDWYIPWVMSGTASTDPARLWQTMPWIRYGKAFRDAEWWQAQGAEVANVEITSSFANLAQGWLPVYFMARGQWAPQTSDADFEAMVTQLCNDLYGAGSADMRLAIRRLNALFNEADTIHGNIWKLPAPNDIVPLGDKTTIDGYFNDALSATAGDPAANARIHHLKDLWDDGWAEQPPR